MHSQNKEKNVVLISNTSDIADKGTSSVSFLGYWNKSFETYSGSEAENVMCSWNSTSFSSWEDS